MLRSSLRTSDLSSFANFSTSTAASRPASIAAGSAELFGSSEGLLDAVSMLRLVCTVPESGPVACQWPRSPFEVEPAVLAVFPRVCRTAMGAFGLQ